jgi:hypothetical protein
MSKDTTEFWVPCPHEPGSCSVSNTLPNYHPLTANEIRDLFEVATTGDQESYDRAMTRLVQGIPGMTCPFPAYGTEVAKVLTWVEHFMTEAAFGDGNFAPLVVLVRVLAADRS